MVMLKRLFAPLCALLFFASSLHATLLKVEDFDYPISTELCQAGWFTQWGAMSDMVVTGGLELAGYAGCGVGGAALIDVDSGSNQPHLAFTKQTSGDVYVAFMFQPIWVTKRGYFFCLRDDQINAITYNYNARVFLNENNQLGLTFADNQKAVMATDALDYGGIYLLVLKYHIVEGANNDQVSLYVFAADEARPALEKDATPLFSGISDAAKTDICPAHVVLRGFDKDGYLVVDGIRVATTWTEAIATTDTGDCGVEPTGITRPASPVVAEKVLIDGQWYIRRGNRLYNVLGDFHQFL